MSSQHIHSQRQVVPLLMWDPALPPAAHRRKPAFPASTGVLDPGGVDVGARREQRPKNATFASLGESLWTGPGGASKKPACAGPGGAACRGLSSNIFSRRAFSARRRASSAATAAGISVTRTPYATVAISLMPEGQATAAHARRLHFVLVGQWQPVVE